MREKFAPTLVLRLKGGLGNQLFQVASADWFARKIGAKTDKRNGLYIFKDESNKYLDTVFRKLPKLDWPKNYCYTIVENEDNFGRYEEFLKAIPWDHPWLELDIYGQWPELWAHDRDHVASLFEFPASTGFPNPGSMGVHFRGGDYVTYAPIHYICRRDYYRPLAKMGGVYRTLVSDDYFQAFEENVETDAVFNGLDELDDFAYLKDCDKLFIGNSTFAWWAAYLGRAKEVWCPKTWLGPAHPHHKKFNLAQPGWNQIEN